MKILIPVLGFSKSGGYRTLSRFATEFVKAGHSVTFLVNHNSDEPYFPTSAAISWVNGFGWSSQQREASKRKQSFISSFFSILFGCWRARKQFDVVIANHSLTVLPIHISGIKAKKIYYIQAYEPEYYAEMVGLKNRIFEYLSEGSYNMPFLRIVNAKIYLNYKSLSAQFMVYPGIDFSVFHTGGRSMQSHDFITIGTIARVEKEKGTRFIIEAFKVLQNIHSNVRIRIAYPENLKVTDFTFEGVTPKDDFQLADYYRSLDIYVAAGTVQFGAIHYPVIESMSCGTLVVTCPVYPVTSSNGVLLEPESSENIVCKVTEVVNHIENYESHLKEALSTVEQFAWEKQYAILSHIIESNN